MNDEEIRKLAEQIDKIAYDYDTYEYKDTVDDRQENIDKIQEDLMKHDTEAYKSYLKEITEDDGDPAIGAEAAIILGKLGELEDAKVSVIKQLKSDLVKPERDIEKVVCRKPETMI